MTARDRPFFSVIMPTRNRGHLLRYSLQSVLNQTFHDFEVIVSDNSSEDDTGRWVSSLTDPRLRLVRTPRPMPMPDSWEFALGHANGQYVIVLCDDDAWCPSMLARSHQVIHQTEADLVNIPHARYRHPTWYDRAECNSVYIPWFRGNVIRRETAQGLRDLFAFRMKDHTPKLLNSFVSRDLLDKARGLGGRLFLGACPDYSIAALTLANSVKWVSLNVPLLIGGVAKESIGAATRYSGGGAARVFFDEFPDGVQFPLGVPATVTSCIAHTLLLIQQRLRAVPRTYSIDWGSFFWGCWVDLLAHEAAGIRIRSAQTDLRRTISSQFPGLASGLLPRLGVTAAAVRVASFLGPHRPRLHNLLAQWRLLRGARDRVIGTWRRLRGWRGGLYLRGEQAGFSTILECARFVDKFIARASGD